MSRSSQKRTHDSSPLCEDSQFGDYGTPLSHHHLRYLNNGVPQPGYFSGRAVGVSPVNGALNVQFETSEGSLLSLRFEGEFAARMNRVVELGTNFRISTRGAVVESGRTTTLRYTSGAHAIVETVLDVWEGQAQRTSEHRPHKRARHSQLGLAPAHEEPFTEDDLWFISQQSLPRGFEAKHNGITIPPTAFPAELPTPDHSSPVDISREDSAMDEDSRDDGDPFAARTLPAYDHDDSSLDDDLPYAREQATPTPAGRRAERNREKALGKRKKREEKKRRKSEITMHSGQASIVQEEPPLTSSQEVENLLQSPTATELDEPTSVPTSLLDTFLPRIVDGSMASYKPIDDLISNRRESFIGVVHFVRGLEQAARGDRDWHQKVTLIDPSNFDKCGGVLYDESKPVGFNVTMFAKYQPWLPHPAPGDILLISNAKIGRVNFDSKLNAMGYADQFKWAIYRRESSSFSELDLGDAPVRHMVTDNHVQYEYTPFLQVGEEERAYCQQLSAWWDEVQQRKTEKKGVVQHIGDEPVSTSVTSSVTKPRKRRQHQLTQDVNPSIQQYFDCTVVIVHVAQSNDMTHVYATDFTGNSTGRGLRPVQTEWCPPNLSDKTLQIEFYGTEASNFVREKALAKDQIWTFCNVRLKSSNGDGHLEATFSEVRKAYRLEEKDIEDNIYLRELLDRKQKFEESNSSPNKFAHSTIAEAEVEGATPTFQTCTVEILSVSRSTVKDAPAKIYVTDHTSRGDLKPPLSTDLQEKYKDVVLMVELQNQQAERADHLNPGDIVRIHNLCMKAGMDGKVAARLGGGDNLIRKLDASSDDPHVLELIKRKASRDVSTPELPSKNDKPVHHQIPPTFARSRPASDKSSKSLIIGEILEDKSDCPATFKLRARVVDYEPKDLSRSIIRACMNCDEPAQPDDPQCQVCQRGAEELKYRFDLAFSLADAPQDFNTVLDVVAGKDWAALADLDPETIALDADGVESIMLRRLGKYLWHLRKPDVQKLGSVFEFTVERRRDANDEVQYHLLSG